MSLAPDTAIPTVALANAGASFTPSPTIAGKRPEEVSAWMRSSFCAGSKSASTCATPTSRAITSAARLRSPVRMM